MALVGLVVTAIFGRGLAWGPDGHAIVAHIAEYYLSPEVADVLKSDDYNVSLTNVSYWCAEYGQSPEGNWSAALHFSNYEGRTCSFDWGTNCKDDWCSAGAIVNYSKQIFDPNTSKADRFFALKFLSHIVGDIHQPLNVASSDDQDGKIINLGKPVFSKTFPAEGDKNLHDVWDTTLLVEDIQELASSSPPSQNSQAFFPVYHNWTVLAELLEERLDGIWGSKKDEWKNLVVGSRDEKKLRDGLAVVAEESAELGCLFAYNHGDGSAVKSGEVLQRDYFLRAQSTLEEQVAKAGVRLATLLEEALAKSRAPEPLLILA
eukprot:TRINITY_DN1050_c0_g2_i1.p1 TRINITY_DN1050_c0_g2~~TRINITY_DN1050_c0_g2_i1.p1  ORF type:complete len:352 (-),score=49.88 TRINITY_DN1050_c0_g2_i1:157-1110(-)